MCREEGKLNLALPGTKSPLVLPQQEPAEYVPAVRGPSCFKVKISYVFETSEDPAGLVP